MNNNDFDYDEKMVLWNSRNMKLNNNLRRKSPFYYLQHIMSEIIGDYNHVDELEYGAVELDYMNIDDDNLIKIFQSFLVGRFDGYGVSLKDDSLENLFVFNVVGTLVSAYYFVATYREHLMDRVNSIISMEKIVNKLEGSKNSYNIQISSYYDKNNFNNSIEEMIGNAEENITRYLVEEVLSTNTYTVTWGYEDPREQYSEEEIRKDLTEGIEKLAEWTYDHWKKTYPFFTRRTENKEDTYVRTCEEIEYLLIDTLDLAGSFTGYPYLELSTTILEEHPDIPRDGQFSDLINKYRRQKEGVIPNEVQYNDRRF